MKHCILLISLLTLTACGGMNGGAQGSGTGDAGRGKVRIGVPF